MKKIFIYVNENGTEHICINRLKVKDCPACVEWIRQKPTLLNQRPKFIKKHQRNDHPTKHPLATRTDRKQLGSSNLRKLEGIIKN